MLDQPAAQLPVAQRTNPERSFTEEVRALRLGEVRPVVCASPAYLARRGTPRTVADLADHDCMGFTLSDTGGTRTWSFGAGGEIKVPIRAVLKANNGGLYGTALGSGVGTIYRLN